MSEELKVLIVEDSEKDAFLVLRKLKESGYGIVHRRVQTYHEMRQALESEKWDIVLSDYVMPTFSGLQTLDLLHEIGLDMPFIVVSGQIGEDVAVEANSNGSGLRGMSERTEILGGKFSVHSGPGSSTTVFASIPIINDVKERSN